MAATELEASAYTLAEIEEAVEVRAMSRALLLHLPYWLYSLCLQVAALATRCAGGAAAAGAEAAGIAASTPSTYYLLPPTSYFLPPNSCLLPPISYLLP